MPKKPEIFVVIDSNALIHRAFHALPPLTNSAGEMTNAVYGFTAILLKTIRDLKPTYIAATFDRKEKTFRHESYDQYKAQRAAAPDELYAQIPLVKDVLTAFNIPIFELAGYEADDLIGTIVAIIRRQHPKIDIVIVTGDKDALQLVDEHTRVLLPHKGVSETLLYDSPLVQAKFGGLTPQQIIDYKALSGDPSDNIPGVRGIGPKGATDLLLEFGTLENIYTQLTNESIKPRLRELLETEREMAFLSQKLATIDCAAPVELDLERCRLHNFDKPTVVSLFQKFEFKRLLSQIQSIETTTEKAAEAAARHEPSDQQTTPQKYDTAHYHAVATVAAAHTLLSQLAKQTIIAIDTETTGIDAFSAALVGISLSWEKGSGWYIPITIIEQIREPLAKLLAQQSLRKVGHNIKYDLEVLTRHGLALGGIYFDTMIASYLLNAGSRQHSLDTLAFVELGYQTEPIEALIGKGKNQISMADVPLERISNYACEDADITWQLYQKFEPELDRQGQRQLFDELEMPLVSVLATMELNGIKVDGDFLHDLGQEFGQKISSIEQEIYGLAGREFNVASPRQLKEVLFETLQISSAGVGRTKTGLSTSASELEKLQGQHPIIDLILEFRELTKLKNTYLDALPQLVNPTDGRIHTSYNQSVAATGRLSSSNPNLQNIPIRTKIGQQIRKAFVAESGHVLVKADYSQIELRIVASLADDPAMLEIFRSGEDIHTQTAALINGVDPSEITPDVRRQAKEINFGVMYGMGAWGLSQRTGISPKEAQYFIDEYFKKFKGVKHYLEGTIAFAREHGYVETLLGRRRAIPEINSSMGQLRSAAERTAVNMPIQGTQADLIKLAMIALDRALSEHFPTSRMLLQVHDELVFEVPESDVQKVVPVIRDTMNGVMELKTPIVTEISVGPNWDETEKVG